MFVPVDVPLVPAEFLRSFASAVLGGPEGLGAAFLLVNGNREPGFALVRHDCLTQVSAALTEGVRRLDELWLSVDTNRGDDWVWTPSARQVAAEAVTGWFTNLNTPDDLQSAEIEHGLRVDT